MKKALFFAFSLSFFSPMVVLAHHPNEGKLELETLVEEALKNNLELKALEKVSEGARHEARSKWASFFPELSFEGGPLVTRWDGEKNSGVAAYGKLEWNLFRGGRDSAKLDLAAAQETYSQTLLSLSRGKLTREVARVYYEMLFLLESRDLKEKALSINQDQMKLALRKKNSGFTSEADVIEFELREATLKSDLRLLDQELMSRSRELSSLLGRADTDSKLLVKGHLEKPKPSFDQEKLLRQIEERNPAVLKAKIEHDQSLSELSIARSDYYPSLDLETLYGKLANEERVFRDKNNYSIFLKLSIPIFSGLETRNESSARSYFAVAKEAELDRARLNAKKESEDAISELSSLLERLDLEEKNLERSEKYYKITSDEYRRGVKNSPDMVGAAERLLEAKVRNLEFRKSYYLTRLHLLDVAGASAKEY